MSDLQIIETRLDKLERMIAGLTPKGQKPNRFVNIFGVCRIFRPQKKFCFMSN
jgi:hypothetical protein